jgi:hypothetical protein
MMSDRAWNSGINDGLTDAAIDIAAKAKNYAPRKTGRLAQSIRVFGRLSGYRRLIVAGGSNVRYAPPHEYGSGLHGSRGRRYAIRPRKAKWLRIPSQEMLNQRRGSRAVLKTRLTGKVASRTQRRYGNDAYVFKKLVMHPGVKGTKFMSRALDESPVAEFLAKALVNEWRRRGAR